MAANAYFAAKLSDDEVVDWSPVGIADRFRKFFVARLTYSGVSKLLFMEHLTYLLFLKLDYERSQRQGRFAQPGVVPAGYSWPKLATKTGEELRQQLTLVLAELAKLDQSVEHPELSTTVAIFRDSHIWNAQHLAHLAALITDEIDPYDWSSNLLALGEAYEILLTGFCAAEVDSKRETGQVITPRPLLRAIAQTQLITSEDTVLDPAPGTGGTLLAAYREMAGTAGHLPETAYAGKDRDHQMVRLATMNILLNTRRPFSAPAPIQHGDSLAAGGAVIHRPAGTPSPTVVLCNPPFRSNTPRPTSRHDLLPTPLFPANFLQHIAVGLPVGARAAVFVPDSVLTGSTAEKILPPLLQTCDLHTMLRLPAGSFRNGTSLSGVKANVLFFTKCSPSPTGTAATSRLWIYDARSLTTQALTETELDDFVDAYAAGLPRHERSPRTYFGSHSYADLQACRFQLFNLAAGPQAPVEPLRPAKEIAGEIAESLAEARQIFADLAAELP
ncbi:N-6 DNA methylase [Kitasatospora sp. NPDC058406]|uniref:class I SAM-dependent DNA methyltransferase n=1 Tax=Kitasatospora sp. NPDC058406 TaxID=3346483 RepID=UPI00365B83BC